MTKKHIWRIKRIYFDQLKSGKKTLEIRVGYPQIKKAQKGDIITFENYGFNEFDVILDLKNINALKTPPNQKPKKRAIDSSFHSRNSSFFPNRYGYLYL